jgi:hypothetical protein
MDTSETGTHLTNPPPCPIILGEARGTPMATQPLRGLEHPLDRPSNTCYTVFMKFRNLKKSRNPKNSKSQKTGFFGF